MKGSGMVVIGGRGAGQTAGAALPQVAICRQPKFALIQALMAAHSGDCWM